jgi:pyruvate/2-oxoglutarate dehydrogenase complex dihydrolipoamide acyltransferase (E2) component
MKKQVTPYRVVDLSPGRRAWLRLLDWDWRKHCMFGLLEVDVTVVRKFIEEHEARTGETLSFTGYLALCLARAVDEDKSVQSYIKGGKQLVVFDDVDVGLMIERRTGEARGLMGHVIRGANHKTYRQIHEEIRLAQSQPVPEGRGMGSWWRLLSLPWPLPNLFSSLLGLAISRDPTIATSMGGTVTITAVGMFGKGLGGWGIAPLTSSLGLIVGSTTWKPAVVEGRIEPRQILNLTVVFDHDVIDGAPATRFTRSFVELIESGYGLGAEQGESRAL